MHALQTSTRQHSLGFSCYSSAECNRISSGTMLQSMIFSAWLTFDSGFLGTRLSQHTTTSAAVPVLSCATCALCPQPADHTSPGKGHRLFSWQDLSGLKETSCFFCSNSVFTCQGLEQGMGMEELESPEGEGFASLLVGPSTFCLPSWAEARLAFWISCVLGVIAVKNFRQRAQRI